MARMRLLGVLLCCLLAGTACSAKQAGVSPKFVHGTDGSTTDRVAAAAVSAGQAFWRAQFPGTFGKSWRPLHGFRSVDTVSGGKACGDRLEGNAVYCPSTDTISWDRAALVPVLRHRFGDAAVVALLGHELGHAVQHRTGVRQGSPGYPPIATEAMADCYSGAALRWIANRHTAGLRLGKHAPDQALRAIMIFRDPVGRSAKAEGAHGDAFDRVTAFGDGYRAGASRCRTINANSREFTQRRFTDLDDAAGGGDMAYGRLVSKTTAALTRWLHRVRPGLAVPPQRTVGTACHGRQGPAGYCSGTVQVGSELAKLHQNLGDWAAGTMLASRYGLADVAASHHPTTGRAARRHALCFSGAFTATLLERSRGFGLSPGDLDEAVRLLLHSPDASADTAGDGLGSGIDRVLSFRAGVTGGLGDC